MFNLNTSRAYALTTGLILFAFGFFEFAFRSSKDMPGWFLLICLALGFWGIIVGANSSNR